MCSYSSLSFLYFSISYLFLSNSIPYLSFSTTTSTTASAHSEIFEISDVGVVDSECHGTWVGESSSDGGDEDLCCFMYILALVA